MPADDTRRLLRELAALLRREGLADMADRAASLGDVGPCAYCGAPADDYLRDGSLTWLCAACWDAAAEAHWQAYLHRSGEEKGR